MTIFAIMCLKPDVPPNDVLGNVIETRYAGANLQIAPNIWLVADSGRTTREVSESLGVVRGSGMRVVVVSIENYFGVASKDIWEWMRVKGKED